MQTKVKVFRGKLADLENEINRWSVTAGVRILNTSISTDYAESGGLLSKETVFAMVVYTPIADK